MTAEQEWHRRMLGAKLKGKPPPDDHVSINDKLYRLVGHVRLPAKTGEQILMPGHREKVEFVVDSIVMISVGAQVTVVLYRGKRMRGKEVARGTLYDLAPKPGWGSWECRVVVEVGSRA